MYKLCPVQCLAHGKYMFMIAIISFGFFWQLFLKNQKECNETYVPIWKQTNI